MVAHSNGRLVHRTAEVTHDDAMLETAVAHHHRLVEINRQLFNYSHPVDEWASSLGAPASSPVEIQPTYEIPERIEGIIVATPAGATGLSLQLGQRTIPLAAGLTVISNVGILLNRSERRLFNFTGLAGPWLVELTGWAVASEDTD